MNILKATQDDIPILSKVLCEAFINDPMINTIVKNDKQKMVRMEIFFNIMLKYALSKGYLYTNDKKNCCAAWIKPEYYDDASYIKLTNIISWIKVIGFDRVLKVLRVYYNLSKYQPKFKNYYLMFLGIQPEIQGKGLGSQIMKPMIEISDNESMPIYLETSNKNNVSFYQKLNFRVIHEVNEDNFLPNTWFMARDPKINIK